MSWYLSLFALVFWWPLYLLNLLFLCFMLFQCYDPRTYHLRLRKITLATYKSFFIPLPQMFAISCAISFPLVQDAPTYHTHSISVRISTNNLYIYQLPKFIVPDGWIEVGLVSRIEVCEAPMEQGSRTTWQDRRAQDTSVNAYLMRLVEETSLIINSDEPSLVSSTTSRGRTSGPLQKQMMICAYWKLDFTLTLHSI